MNEMPDDKFKVGMIGCGKISNRYLPQCNGFDILDVVACADMVPERAREQAAEYHAIVSRFPTPRGQQIKKMKCHSKAIAF